MDELFSLLMTFSFIGIFVAPCISARASVKRFLFGAFFFLLLASCAMATYGDEILAVCTVLITWLGRGAAALVLIVILLKAGLKLLFGRRI